VGKGAGERCGRECGTGSQGWGAAGTLAALQGRSRKER
jgi:hypothetical protein